MGRSKPIPLQLVSVGEKINYLEQKLLEDTCLMDLMSPDSFYQERRNKYLMISENSWKKAQGFAKDDYFDFANAYRIQAIKQKYVSDWYFERLREVYKKELRF